MEELKKLIKLKSRNSNNYLKLLTNISNTDSVAYLLQTQYPTIKVGYLSIDNKDTLYIEPSGGPTIYKGVEINNIVVKDIQHCYGVGYIIIIK